MTPKVHYRPAALSDLANIGDYTAGRWGKQQTRTYIGQIADTIDRVLATPGIGQAANHITPGLRKIRSGSHIIFYYIGNGRIDVVRILHQRMDLEGRF